MLYVTDDDFQKSKAAFSQYGNNAYVSTHDGAGNITRVQTNPSLKGAIQTTWSGDYGKSWNSLVIGIILNSATSSILYGDLNNGYIQRIHKSTDVAYDLHVDENELCLYKSTDNGATWEKAWDVNIVKTT